MRLRFPAILFHIFDANSLYLQDFFMFKSNLQIKSYYLV